MSISQDNFNVLHIAAMNSREDVVKALLNKRGVDPFSTGGVSIFIYYILLMVSRESKNKKNIWSSKKKCSSIVTPSIYKNIQKNKNFSVFFFYNLVLAVFSSSSWFINITHIASGKHILPWINGSVLSAQKRAQTHVGSI